MERDWLEMKEAAKYLEVSCETVKGWLKGRGGNDFKEYTTKIGQKRVITNENARRFVRGWNPEADPQERLLRNEELHSNIDGVST